MRVIVSSLAIIVVGHLWNECGWRGGLEVQTTPAVIGDYLVGAAVEVVLTVLCNSAAFTAAEGVEEVPVNAADLIEERGCGRGGERYSSISEMATGVFDDRLKLPGE